MDHIAESTIYSTKDYNKFKLIQGNRPKSKGHIRHLIQSFDSNPDLARTRPILVNEKFEIIDGQHRYEACLSLGIPVYYTAAKNVDVSTARLLNANQRAWKLVDFLNSFVSSGSEQYIKLQGLWEEYPIPLSTLMVYAAGHKNRALRQQFRNGTFKLMKDKELLMHRLDSLREIAEHFQYWKDGGFAEAYFSVYANPDFEPDRLLDKLKQTKFERQTTTMDYLREIERVYNFNSKAPSRLF